MFAEMSEEQKRSARPGVTRLKSHCHWSLLCPGRRSVFSVPSIMSASTIARWNAISLTRSEEEPATSKVLFKIHSA